MSSRLRMKRGDSASWEFPVLDRYDAPQSIVGALMRFTAKLRRTDTDPEAVIAHTTSDGGVVLTYPQIGLCEVRLDPADTDSLDAPVTLLWDLQARDAAGDVFTIDIGMLIVEADITRTVP